MHLGAHGDRALLHARPPAEPLREALRGVDRLVLLGDTVEFRQGPRRDALAVASRVLPGLAAALGPAGEVLIVPGNHDHHLLAPWLGRRAAGIESPPLGLQAEVGWADGEPLAVLADALSPAAVRAYYPGVWLRDDVYATHGHYGDLHTTVPMLERVGARVMSRILRIEQTSKAEDYEAVLAPMYAWIDAVAQAGGPEAGGSENLSARIRRSLSGEDQGGRGDHGHGGLRNPDRGHGGGGETGGRHGSLGDPDHGHGVRGDTEGRHGGVVGQLRGPGSRLLARVRRRGLAGALGSALAAANRAGLGPLRADLSDAELRRAALIAFAAALSSLRVESDYVIFGHTHRAGPLPDDDPAEWTALNGACMLNSGCWVHEPAFLGRDPLRSPYRAGFCVVVDDDGPPRLVNLLDGPAPDSLGRSPRYAGSTSKRHLGLASAPPSDASPGRQARA